MRKYLLILFCIISMSAAAQTQWYRTTAFAQATVRNGHYYWGDWKTSNMKVCFNLATDVITIYSPNIQIYRIYSTYNNGNAYYDNDGGTTVKFFVKDQDGDYGSVRLRVDNTGTSQIYIDFNNIAWVYNVIRIN